MPGRRVRPTSSRDRRPHRPPLRWHSAVRRKAAVAARVGFVLRLDGSRTSLAQPLAHVRRAGLEGRAVGEPQPAEVAGVVEQPPTGARHDGRERQHEHVEQPVGQQIACEASAASSVSSSVTGITVPLPPLAVGTSSGSRAVANTVHPSPASRFASAEPTPREPPVISTVFELGIAVSISPSRSQRTWWLL
jgi:hypothetical protein